MEKYLIVKIAENKFKQKQNELVHFVDDKNQNEFINNIEKYPHAYVLACLMDKQIKAERAWAIPYIVYQELGNFDIDFLYSVPLDKFIEIFENRKLHRFNKIEATNFYKAVKRIKEQYNGDASAIWSNKPSSAQVVYRFLEFEGIGIKIATMATNILVRQFYIKLSDYYSIDISPDVHVKRVMYRMGLVNKNPTPDMIIYKARQLNPKFPGLIDLSCWEIGRNYCHPTTPRCDKCEINKDCKKVGLK